MLGRRLSKLNLQVKFALASLVPVTLLGLGLSHAVGQTIDDRAVARGRSEAALVFQTAFRPRLKGEDPGNGIGRARRAALNRTAHGDGVRERLAGVRIFDHRLRSVYSSEGGRAVPAEARVALRGRTAAKVTTVGETAGPSATGAGGKALAVYLPMASESGRRTGAAEVALRFEPIEAAASRDAGKLRRLLLAGLALLYGALLVLVGAVSKRLERHARGKELLALHDSLTGLPNRTLFRDLVNRAIVAGRRKRGLVAVMLMDLDRFKEVNDTLGHFNGDQLLERIGVRLKGAVRGGDTVARLGGDEFAVVLVEARDREAVVVATKRILKVFEEPFVVGGLALEVQASIGIAVCPDNGKRVSELMQSADVAMYVAKKAHSGFEFYSEDQHQYSPDRLELIGELRRAIDENELVLFYQPKVELRTGRVKGVEALVRWDHPRRGLLPPSEFVPLAERTSLIKRFTLHLLEQALRQCRAWHDEGLELSVAVNLSMQNLVDLHLPDDVLRLLREYEMDPKWLELEITESVIMSEPRRARAVLDRLAEMGVALAIDDFGTGYSSLSYLKQLPVSSIKIDKSFVLAMDDDQDDEAIVRSTIDLGRNLGLSVVAEGIESQRVFERLATLGSDHGQGFHMSKPLPADKLSRWVGAYHDLMGPGARASAPGVQTLSQA